MSLMATDRPAHNTLSPLLIMGSPRSGTTFLANMVNRFFDIRLNRDNGSLLRFYGLLSHYDPEFGELFKVSADFDWRMERSHPRM